MQIYGNFQGFPEKNSALFGLVSYNDLCSHQPFSGIVI